MMNSHNRRSGRKIVPIVTGGMTVGVTPALGPVSAADAAGSSNSISGSMLAGGCPLSLTLAGIAVGGEMSGSWVGTGTGAGVSVGGSVAWTWTAGASEIGRAH